MEKMNLFMKKTITESQLRNIIAESVKNVLMSEGLFGGVKTAKNANDVNAMFQELRSAVPNELQFTNATYPNLNEPAFRYLQSMKYKIEEAWRKAQEAYNEIVRGGRMDNYLLGNFNNCYRIIMQDCNTRTMKKGLKTAWKSYRG